MLTWVGIGLPLAAAVLLTQMGLDPSLCAGVLLSLPAPPVGSAAAIAAMLGLRARFALLISVALTLVSPLSIPLFGSLLSLGIAFDMETLAVRLISIIGAAATLDFSTIRLRGTLTPILPDQRAATGIAVIGLVVAGLATSSAIRKQWQNDPAGFLKMLAAAVTINFGICYLSMLLFLMLGVGIAGTIGLVSGNRPVTLTWAAASSGLPALVEGFVAACVIPVLALPLLVKMGVALVATAKESRRQHSVPSNHR
ncbi:MAG: hypothetical protein ABW006_04705 [Hyphomicrobium sp.]